MSLEKIISKIRTDFLPQNKERVKDYVRKYELGNYFREDIPQYYRDRFDKGLSQIIDEVSREYSPELAGILRTPIGKGTMGLAVANDLSAYVTTTPFDNVTALGYVLFAAKTIAEFPALSRYVRKSKDWYGAIKHLLLKPIRYLIPVIGPALESGAFERMVKRRVRKEVVRRFAQRYSRNYQKMEDRLKEKLKEPLRENLELVEV